MSEDNQGPPELSSPLRPDIWATRQRAQKAFDAYADTAQCACLTCWLMRTGNAQLLNPGPKR